MSDYVGEKMATLGELRNRLGLKVPEGFVISTYAFKQFIETNRLEEWVAPLSEGKFNQRGHGGKGQRIEGTDPEGQNSSGNQESHPENPSFAGKGRSGRLGGSQQRRGGRQSNQLCRTVYHGFKCSSSRNRLGYKQVVASLFSPQVIIYRKERGIKQQEMAMAVGCLPMISPVVSGVIYTADPTGLEGEEMILSACWGLGKLVVDGEGEVDQYKVSKTFPYPVLWQHIGKKSKQYALSGKEGIALVPVSPEKQEIPCLNESLMREIIEGAIRIEQYMKSFQDIEWSIDQEGRVTYLQARPLQFSGKLKIDKNRLITAAQKYPVLLKDTGVIASRGIGAGTVFQVQSEEESRHFPRGAVLVLKHTSPRMSKIVPWPARW